MAFCASFLILSSSALSSKIFCGMPVGCSLALANKVHNSWESRCKTQPQHTAPLPHLQKLHTCPQCSETYKAITSAHACPVSILMACKLQPDELCKCSALQGMQTPIWQVQASSGLTQANDCTLTNRLVFFSRKPVRAICNSFGSKFCTTNHSVNTISSIDVHLSASQLNLLCAEPTFLSSPSCSCI